MAENNEEGTGTGAPPEGETNDERAARLQAEREANAAEDKVRGIIRSELKEWATKDLPKLLPTSTSPKSETEKSPKRRNAIEKMLGL